MTEAGALLAREAGNLLAHGEQVEARLAARRGAVAGTLSIAALATATRGLMPGALRDLRSRYPDLSVSLSEQEPHQAIPALSRGDTDIAVVQEWPDALLAIPGGLARRDLLEDAFDVALPAGHPLAGQDTVAITELADDNWISWSTGQICHDWLVRTLRAHGAQPRILHTASEHSTQLALVAAGFGAAVIPRARPRPCIRNGQVRTDRPITGPPHLRTVERKLSPRPAISATLDALQRSCPTRT